MTNPSPTNPTADSRRLVSLDALRGFDMFWILGGDSLVYALHAMKANSVTSFLATQLDHVEWQGFHCYDLIFPLFVFIMGVSTVFSLEKIIQRDGRAAAVRRVLIRGALIFVLGLIYNGGLSHPWPQVRLMGVLGRIALCYTFGGLVFIACDRRVMIAIAAALLLGYWAMLEWVPFPDVRPTPGGTSAISLKAGFKSVSQLNMASTNMLHGTYIQGVNLTDYLDQKYLPGHKYDGTYDPEGLLSTLPAFATGLLGIFAGLFLRHSRMPDSKKAACLLAAGAVGLALGALWGLEMPIIKKIWTSSYVLVAGGCSAILLGAFYWVVEVRRWNAWCQAFIWIGMNPITLYLMDNFLGGFDRLGERLTGGSVSNFFDAHVAEGFGDVVVAATGILLFLLLARFLYQRKIFLRV